MKKRILLISHNSFERESLAEILRDRYEVLLAPSGRAAVEQFAATSVSALVLEHGTPFDGADVFGGSARTVTELTDIDPFLPLVLLCDPADELDHPTSLMADKVMRHPVDADALLEALDLVLTETLKERVFRKSGHVAVLR
jgi:DNA-binding response OmpR family regulator